GRVNEKNRGPESGRGSVGSWRELVLALLLRVGVRVAVGVAAGAVARSGLGSRLRGRLRRGRLTLGLRGGVRRRLVALLDAVRVRHARRRLVLYSGRRLRRGGLL